MKGVDILLRTKSPNNSHRGIIVGLDPGLTVGIAILNLRGELISLASFKEIRRSEIVSHIIRYGSTVLVATDVYPHPKTVKKIASILNSKIWAPYKNMSVESKIDIVDSYLNGIEGDKSFLEIPQNAHERDALAAAVKTYNDHLNKFRQIEKRAEKANISPELIDYVKIMVINGKSISNTIKQVSEDIYNDTNNSESLSKLKNSDSSIRHESELNKDNRRIKGIDETSIHKDVKDGINIEDSTEKSISNDAIISRLRNKLNSQKRFIDNLKHKNSNLENQLSHKKVEISKFQSKLDKLHNEYSKKILEKKEFESKIAIIKRLQEKLSEEKALRLELEQKIRYNSEMNTLKLSDNVLPVKIIESFTKDGIKEAVDHWKIDKNDVVLLKNSEGGGSNTAAMISEIGVKAVLTMEKISDPAERIFLNHMIPLIPAENVEINFMKEFAIINSETLNVEIEKWNDQTLNQKNNEDKEKLINLVEEYRAHRRRLLE
jgi:uncharacterized protein